MPSTINPPTGPRTVRGCGPDAGLRERADRLSPVVFQAGLKAGFCPTLASSGPVCPGIALLLAHCLAARPLPPAYGLGDGAKPPENRQNLPVDALHQLWQDGAAMNESEKQFSFTRGASVRHEVVFETAWLDWNPDQVLRVAAGILRKQASDGMPRNAPGPLPEV